VDKASLVLYIRVSAQIRHEKAPEVFDLIYLPRPSGLVTGGMQLPLSLALVFSEAFHIVDTVADREKSDDA
jgi:hypothetical protein